ncbi:hypothetical protein ACQ5SP_15945 [Rhodovulum sp. YNF3179]|uniref:hypothetical protein n=1 Tax=Rhodovulum sp. YNF3179 TaxID=3425127 RepID=UPI003D33B3ED
MSRKQEQQAMRDWVVAEGYDTFCTLKFKNGYDIDERQAERVVQLFLQCVDRTYWGKRVERENLRCPRFVFKQRGISRQNTHFHIVMQAHGDMHTFLQVLRSTWVGFNEACPIASRFEKARNTAATGTYCTHEWTHLGSETFCDKLSHTASTAGAHAGNNIHKLRRLLKAL